MLNKIELYKRSLAHIVGCLITALYYNNLGYVLAQVVSLVFRKQNARSKMVHLMRILLSHLLKNTRLSTCAKT